MSRRVAVVSAGRSDYSYLRPLLQRMHTDERWETHLIVAGTHVSERFGGTLRDVDTDGFGPPECVDTSTEHGTPEAIAVATGRAVEAFAMIYARNRPDMLVVLGDRYEAHAAAVAAVPFLIPIAHLHGGELTLGATDELLRHSLTKLSHLHMVAMDEFRRRVIQLGEEPWRVEVVGSLAVDSLLTVRPLPRGEIERRLNMRIDEPPIVVTYHPVTTDPAKGTARIDVLLRVLADVGRPLVITYPGPDEGADTIITRIESFAAGRSNVRVTKSLGVVLYYSMLHQSAAVVGNSSSGIIEAASFGLPAVDIGSRQAGRPRGPHVVHVAEDLDEAAIRRGIDVALDPAFRSALTNENPYGDGHAAERIVEVLAGVALDRRLTQKRFHDVTGAVPQ